MTAAADVESRALDLVDAEHVAALCAGLVDIASPTGEEAAAARWIADRLAAIGLESHVQPLDDRQANAWAATGEPGDGPDLLLYAPIDTLTSGDPHEDVPQIGDHLPEHAVARSRRRGSRIVGLGAHNPKGHAACVMAAIEAVHLAGVPLLGRLVAAFGAGGMPTNARSNDHARRNVGHGVGASFLLEQGGWADAAIIAKSGWGVAWEEVGLVWIDVTVRGTYTYVGARHRLPYTNAIERAAFVVQHLERWFPTFAERHRDGLVEPQGVVASIQAGWPRMAAVTPASATVRVDLRIPPGMSPLDAKRELDERLAELRAGAEEIDLTTTLVLAIPGSRTDPDHWITASTIAAWEDTAGTRHAPITGTSGATDANILRNRGIPTVRVGLPKVTDDGTELDFGAGMNSVDIGALELLTRHLVLCAVRICTSRRADLVTSTTGAAL